QLKFKYDESNRISSERSQILDRYPSIDVTEYENRIRDLDQEVYVLLENIVNDEEIQYMLPIQHVTEAGRAEREVYGADTENNTWNGINQKIKNRLNDEAIKEIKND